MKKNKFDKAYLKSINIIKEDADEQTADTDSSENTVKIISFKTSDPAVIDAFTNGFDKVVISVPSTDDQGTFEDIEIGKDSFSDFNITDDVQEQETEQKDITQEDSEIGDDETSTDNIDTNINEEKQTKCVTCNGTGVCKDESGDDCDCEKCDGTGVCKDGSCSETTNECGSITEDDQTQNITSDEEDEEEDEEEPTQECNSFESALRRIKAKYLIK